MARVSALGFLIYRDLVRRPTVPRLDPLERAQPAFFRFLDNRMWLDELYARTVIARLASRASFRFYGPLCLGWPGSRLGAIGHFFGSAHESLDERGINAGVDEAADGTRGLGRLISRRHSGQIQTYLGAIAVGMLALLILYAWLA